MLVHIFLLQAWLGKMLVMETYIVQGNIHEKLNTLGHDSYMDYLLSG